MCGRTPAIAAAQTRTLRLPRSTRAAQHHSQSQSKVALVNDGKHHEQRNNGAANDVHRDDERSHDQCFQHAETGSSGYTFVVEERVGGDEVSLSISAVAQSFCYLCSKVAAASLLTMCSTRVAAARDTRTCGSWAAASSGAPWREVALVNVGLRGAGWSKPASR